MTVVRRLALGLLCLIVRLVQLLVLGTYLTIAAVPALILIGIGLVVLAFMAAEVRCNAAAPPQRCARSWAGASPPMSRAADMR